jgi:NADP-dependent 3-hydroxy acid dehydrogenase YdfG
MKNILIAGGTDGIGLALIKCIDPSHYDKIYVLGRDFSQVESLKISNIVQLHCDITDQAAMTDALAHVDQPLDQFINTIGTFYRSTVDDITAKDVSSHFELNSIANINLTNAILPMLKSEFSEILICLVTLALEARENYALQSATKAAYKYYLDTLRIEKRSCVKVMVFYPSSVATDIFKKAGDLRDTSNYPSVEKIASVMYFMLEQPREVYIPELKIESF